VFTLNAKSKKKSALTGLSILFVVSMGILLLGVNGVIGSLSLAGDNVVFGNSIVGSAVAQNDPNAQSITYFTCNTAGSVTNIVAYISGVSSGNAQAALYGDDGSLISQSNSVSIGTSYSWVVFPLPYAYVTDVGHTYGLAVMGDVRINVYVTTGDGTRIAGPGLGNFASGFSDPFGTVWGPDNGAMSIYASGALTSNTSPSPSAAITSTPAPSGIVATLGITYNHAQGSISMPLSPFAVTTTQGQENYQYYSGTNIIILVNPGVGYRFDHFEVYASSTPFVVFENPWNTQVDSSEQIDVIFAPATSGSTGTNSVSLAILGSGGIAISAISLCLVGLGKVKI
jgi:hypothetical protein